jgi:putative N6-adenine-specific DNA methylase
MNENINIFITTAFGLEAVAKRELFLLGFDELTVEDGKISFLGKLRDIPKLNIWLRTADRVYISLKKFRAESFETLFNEVNKINWEDFISSDDRIIVVGKSVKSQLHSVPTCQSIVKKSIIKKLLSGNINELRETGNEIKVFFSILKDEVEISLDTSGDGLFKRGYKSNITATLKETLAAGIVLLSRWNNQEMLIDPMCGAGTILIEAALIAKNIAPGIQRKFISENWKFMKNEYWEQERKNAKKAKNKGVSASIYGYDSDEETINIAIANSKKAGVDNIIRFEKKSLKELWIDKEFGTMITDPPYGIRLEDEKEARKITKQLGQMFKKKSGWSSFILSPVMGFESLFGRSADKKRKLYNGRIKVNLYQYYKTNKS